jgi:hypothetical protein
MPWPLISLVASLAVIFPVTACGNPFIRDLMEKHKPETDAEDQAAGQPGGDSPLPLLSGTVSITGTPIVGATLTANTSGLAGSGTISYQWNRGTAAVGSGAPTYTLTASDVGRPIIVTVSRAGYGGIKVSAPTAAVLGGLGALIAGVPNGGTVTLQSGTYEMTAAATIGKDVTITTEPGAAVTLERGASYTTGPLFDVPASGNLTLTAGAGGDLILDGGYDTAAGTGVISDSAALTVAGDLVLGDGVTVKNNKNTTIGKGGGVFVESGGSLTMNPGSSIEYNEGGDGGGVAVQGRFTMNGGTIQYNNAKPGNPNPDGGGVLVDAGGEFTMNHGEIAYNYAENTGGGVSVFRENTIILPISTFTMNGGSIHHNRCAGERGGGGGGVHVGRASFIMNNGAIHDNEAIKEGGGVCVWQATSTFNMDGGSITSNHTTTGAYGGVYEAAGGATSGTGTVITGNVPSDKNF